MSFTINSENGDRKTCDDCGAEMPVSSGHICAHILHDHVRVARGEPSQLDSEKGPK